MDKQDIIYELEDINCYLSLNDTVSYDIKERLTSIIYELSADTDFKNLDCRSQCSFYQFIGFYVIIKDINFFDYILIGNYKEQISEMIKIFYPIFIMDDWNKKLDILQKMNFDKDHVFYYNKEMAICFCKYKLASDGGYHISDDDIDHVHDLSRDNIYGQERNPLAKVLYIQMNILRGEISNDEISNIFDEMISYYSDGGDDLNDLVTARLMYDYALSIFSVNNTFTDNKAWSLIEKSYKWNPEDPDTRYTLDILSIGKHMEESVNE